MTQAPISFDSVSKSFDGIRVIDNLTHAFKPGSLTFVEGPSGAGKTTLLRLACGLEHPDEGRVVVPRNLRCSIVFQDDRLCENLSATANVRLSVSPDCDRVKAVGMARGILEGLGLGASLDKPVRRLSGGQRRRVALARALMAPADALLLDEPLNGLDEATKELVLAFAKPYLAGKAVLWVTHDAGEYHAFESYDVLCIGRRSEG